MGKNYKLHGGKKERLYMVWCTMKQRCLNPNNKQYAYYGARGITICEEWMHDYSVFRKWSLENGYEDNGKLSIDRINNDGNYEPENCRWVDRITQANNQSTNVIISYNGKTQTLRQWSRETGISAHTLYYRYSSGKATEEIFKKYDVKNIGCTRTDVRADNVIELRKKGFSVAEIANTLGCCKNTVRKRLKALKQMGE